MGGSDEAFEAAGHFMAALGSSATQKREELKILRKCRVPPPPPLEKCENKILPNSVPRLPGALHCPCAP